MALRYRKNINCLSANELHDLREALAAMYALPASDPSSFARQASFHGGPPVAYCRHGAPGFFTWHRAQIKAFEDALRSIRCDATLPYWDWSSGPTTGIPAACRHPTYTNRAGNTVPNPLYAGPRPSGGTTSRSANVDSASFADLATSVQSAMTNTSFTSFQSAINGAHGSVHVRVGGDMGSVPTASYDPIFYLHHANVDRLWAVWQNTHPGSLPATEASFELQPFARPFTNQWQRGSDVESTDALGYRYRPWCFILPPFRIWEVVRIPFPPILRQRLTAARLIARAHHMQDRPIEVRIFINHEGASARTRTAGNPAFAGAFGFIGHPGAPFHGKSEKQSPAAARAAIAIEEARCEACAAAGHTHDHAAHAPGLSHAHSHAANGEHAHAGGHSPHAPTPPGIREQFDVEIDIAAALRATDKELDELQIKLIAVDSDGNEVRPEQARLDGIELVIEDGTGTITELEARRLAASEIEPLGTPAATSADDVIGADLRSSEARAKASIA